jgi:hypothetical protein
MVWSNLWLATVTKGVHSEPTKYFTLIFKLNEENKDLPEIENRTDNIISDIQIRENEILPFLNMEITWAIFHADRYLPWAKDLLNIILSGFAIFVWWYF